MNDIDAQVSFIASSVERILSWISIDPLSPSYGSAHLAHWRDKTSDIADMRRQEVAFALALLFKNQYPGSPWRGNPRLLRAISALLTFWVRNQYPDGSFDEWYRGERAFAAAAFSAHAIARTLDLIQDELDPALRDQTRNALMRTARWLSGREDLLKTNHQTVGAAALAFCGKVLEEPKFRRKAEAKLQSVVMAATSEGWFLEIRNMDLGYIFLTVEYAAMTMHLWNDWSHAECFQTAFDFAAEWLHPDLTLGEEYGICGNAYVSRIATVLMSDRSEYAVWMRREFERRNIGFAALRPTLSDDLRLARWAFQPLLSYRYAQANPCDEGRRGTPVPLADPNGSSESILVREDAGLARLSVKGKPILFTAAAGGLVRFFDSNTTIQTEFGFALSLGSLKATNVTYDRDEAIKQKGLALVVERPLVPVKHFIPSFPARIFLRIACSSALGSRLSRKFIDWVRARKGTALNQSAKNLRGNSRNRLIRTVSLLEDGIKIEDQLNFERQVNREAVFILTSLGNTPMTMTPVCELFPALPASFKKITLQRRFSAIRGWEMTAAHAEAA